MKGQVLGSGVRGSCGDVGKRCEKNGGCSGFATSWNTTPSNALCLLAGMPRIDTGTWQSVLVYISALVPYSNKKCTLSCSFSPPESHRFRLRELHGRICRPILRVKNVYFKYLHVVHDRGRDRLTSPLLGTADNRQTH